MEFVFKSENCNVSKRINFRIWVEYVKGYDDVNVILKKVKKIKKIAQVK